MIVTKEARCRREWKRGRKKEEGQYFERLSHLHSLYYDYFSNTFYRLECLVILNIQAL